jgi:hypothetical protein
MLSVACSGIGGVAWRTFVLPVIASKPATAHKATATISAASHPPTAVAKPGAPALHRKLALRQLQLLTSQPARLL